MNATEQPTESGTPNPDEDWRVRYAREILTKSKAAPSERDQAARWWGANETALEQLLAYVDEQAGGAS